MSEKDFDLGNQDDADAAHWRHALGQMQFVSPEDQERLVLVLLYTKQQVDGEGATKESEMIALLEWADRVRAEAGLLENVLIGSSYVRMRDGVPVFSPSPKGMAEGREIARDMGLPDMPMIIPPPEPWSPDDDD